MEPACSPQTRSPPGLQSSWHRSWWWIIEKERFRKVGGEQVTILDSLAALNVSADGHGYTRTRDGPWHVVYCVACHVGTGRNVSAPVEGQGGTIFKFGCRRVD